MAFHYVELNGTGDKNLFEVSSKETRVDKEETITMHSSNFVIQRKKEQEHG